MWWWITGGIIVLLILVVGIPYMNQQNNLMNQIQQIPQGGGPGMARINDIIQNLKDYEGQNVSVEGEISKIFTQRVFEIDQTATTSGDEILVISKNPLPPNTQGTVSVTGNVWVFETLRIERELGVNLDPQIEADYEGRAFIVADQVTQQ